VCPCAVCPCALRCPSGRSDAPSPGFSQFAALLPARRRSSLARKRTESERPIERLRNRIYIASKRVLASWKQRGEQARTGPSLPFSRLPRHKRRAGEWQSHIAGALADEELIAFVMGGSAA